MTDITGDEFDNALNLDLRLSRGQAREKLGMSHDTRFTNYREALARLGHPTYLVQTLAEAAEFYAGGDIAVFPLHSPVGDGCSCGKADCTDIGKHPRTKHGLKDATTDLVEVQQWWGQWPDANIGSPIPAGYVVFDVDVKSGGDIKTLGRIPRTAVARSGGRGGWHVWFKLPDGIEKPPKSKYDALPGIEVWGWGHFMVLPPSVAKSRYEWEQHLGDLYSFVTDMPGHLVDILVGRVQPDPNLVLSQNRTEHGNKSELLSRIRTEHGDTVAPEQHTVSPTQPDVAATQQNHWLTQAISKAELGNRNTVGFDLALQLRDDGMTWYDAGDVMLEYVRQVGQYGGDPYTEAEALKSLGQAYKREAREPAQAREDDERLDAGEKRLDLDLPLDLDLSSLPFSSLDFPSCKVQFMRLSEEADTIEAEHLDDRRCAPGTPHYIRRQAQWKVLRTVWTLLAPGDTLSIPLMSKWLSKCEQNEPGIECIQVVDCLLATYENHLRFGKGKDIEHPRQFYGNALLHQLDEDFGWKRAELKAKVKAAAKGQEPVEGLVRVWEEPTV